MMMGRDESMPNIGPTQLTTEQRTKVRKAAEQFFKDGSLMVRIDLLCQAILEFVPEDMIPQIVSKPDEKTMPMAAILPPGGVLGTMSGDSDGVCEPSGDDSRTQQALVDHTSMVRNQDGSAYIVKRGSANAVPVPRLDITKR